MSVAALHRDTAFQARSLFRSLLRTSSQFSNYNFREYARRKTRDMFRENQNESQERRIQELMQKGLQDLRLLKVSLPLSTWLSWLPLRDARTMRSKYRNGFVMISSVYAKVQNEK
ncbi:hypothetical protein N7533_000651 [Penicillium manginii]|uniref:uncharacterized protein n=1 Tax=Penicillium manginii TaxID=203109 RepID=UPI002548E804|nr:uncharacterized protein N7533_000651 [Penicillium manginii]KAJ5768068.1 hypothetical protein N7533_000651 [Penicillium manginii]